jgi:hypothetical protein
MTWMLIAFICFSEPNVGIGKHDCNSYHVNSYSTVHECRKYGFRLNEIKARVITVSCVILKGEHIA